MERARHRRSKSVSVIEGTRQVKKQNVISRLSPGSPSYADENNWNNMLFGQVNGMPMKKLLAEEMSIEVEPKRRSPSVIARLMGLEVMPPPCHGHVRRQQKRSPASQRKSAPANFQENSQLHDGRLSRRSSTDQQEYKDVFEDLEASHILNHQHSSRWHGTRPKLPLVQQKFIDVNRLSTDQRLRDLEELYGTLEMPGTDHDLLLQFIQQPNSLSINNLHDPQIDSHGSLGCQIAVLKPLNSVRYESKAKSRRPLGEGVKKHHVTSHRMREDALLLEPYNGHRVHTSSYSSKNHSDDRNEMYKLPTKVVILKPNPMKTSVYKDGASLNPSHSYQQHCKETNGVGSSMAISTKARRIAREITTRMRNGCDAIKGYAGDESSYDGTESDSESESEAFKPPSRMSLNDHRYPCSHRGETPLIREAKKQTSERWKTTHNYQDMEMSVKANTLGEMLSLSERETRHCLLNRKMNSGRPSDRLGYNGHHPVMRDRPFRISTSDAWKEELVKGLSRSMSLPPSGDHRRTPRMSTPDHNVIEDKPMIHSGRVCHGRSNSPGKNHKEHNSPKDSKSRDTRHRPDQQMLISETNSSSKASFENQTEKNTEDLTEQKSIFYITTEEEMRKNLEPNVMPIAEPESRNTSESPNLHSKPLSSIVSGEKSSTDDFNNSALQELPEQRSSSLQCFETDPDPSDNSRGADHSSPVSVLEVPSTEDTPSSFESFDRVSAELHELRMQLQLLKMEASGCTDESFIGEEEPAMMQPSPIPSERNYRLESEGWEVSYTNDILTDSVMSHTAWHSSESPLDPKQFDFLENKYGNNNTRSERRLRFDRVNSAILQVFDEHVESSLLMPRLGVKSMGGKEDVIEKLMKEERGRDDDGHEIVQRPWEEPKGEMVVIGNEIEKLMIDDIIMEVVSY